MESHVAGIIIVSGNLRTEDHSQEISDCSPITTHTPDVKDTTAPNRPELAEKLLVVLTPQNSPSEPDSSVNEQPTSRGPIVALSFENKCCNFATYGSVYASFHNMYKLRHVRTVQRMFLNRTASNRSGIVFSRPDRQTGVHKRKNAETFTTMKRTRGSLHSGLFLQGHAALMKSLSTPGAS